MGSTHFTLLTGMILVAYMRELGLTYRGIGVLSGLSAFAIVFQLVGAHVTSLIGRRKTFWFYCAMIERICRGLAVVLPFYLVRHSTSYATVALVGFLTLAQVFLALAVTPWMSWFADIIPAKEHGRFWGRRQAWISFALVLVILPCAAFIDRWTDAGLRTEAMLLVFALALGLGYVDLFIHRTIPEPAMRPEPQRRLGATALAALRNRRFRPWLVFTGAWSFSMQLGAVASVLYINEYLGFDHNLFVGMLVLVAVPQVSTILMGRYVGGLIDRLGTRPVLRASYAVWALTLLALALISPGPGAGAFMAGLFLISNFAVISAANAANKLVTRLPRREDRSMYLAVSSCVGCLALGVGSLAGGEALEAFKGWSWQLGGREVVGYHVLFAISTVLRLASLTLTRWLPSPAAERAHIDEVEEERRASRRLAKPVA